MRSVIIMLVNISIFDPIALNSAATFNLNNKTVWTTDNSLHKKLAQDNLPHI